MAVPPNIASLLSRSSRAIIVDSREAVRQEPPAADEWEPPTPAEWDRALRIFALQVVRELAQRSCSLRLLRLLGWR